ncbi:MAG: hypothetical protein K9K32_00080 [Halanaerobiales bacterium]|nr:hypothetical protein [Halanaerobiales bacterium]
MQQIIEIDNFNNFKEGDLVRFKDDHHNYTRIGIILKKYDDKIELITKFYDKQRHMKIEIRSNNSIISIMYLADFSFAITGKIIEHNAKKQLANLIGNYIE